MGVDLRNGMCADDLASDIGVVGEQAVVRIMNAVRATKPPTNEVGHPESESTSPSVPSRAASDSIDVEQVQREIAFHVLHAAVGDAAAARRVAELCELIDTHEEAAAWWHRAAELGDGDAEAYVRHILARKEPVHRARPSRRTG